MEKHLHHDDRNCVQTFSIIIVLSFCARALNVLSLLGLSLFSPSVRHSPSISPCVLSHQSICLSLYRVLYLVILPQAPILFLSHPWQLSSQQSPRQVYAYWLRALHRTHGEKCRERERKCRESICLIYPSHAKQIRKIRFSSSCIFYMGLISVLIFAVRNTVKERMKKSN